VAASALIMLFIENLLKFSKKNFSKYIDLRKSREIMNLLEDSGIFFS
jgi:hypothetical protein